MALIKQNLKSSILSLMDEMRTKENNADNYFADQLSTIIDDYIKTATITVAAGIPVSTAGTSVTQTGATTAPATATIN
jgi:hypothetical protein